MRDYEQASRIQAQSNVPTNYAQALKEVTLTTRLAECARRIANNRADISVVRTNIFGLSEDPTGSCASTAIPQSLSDYVGEIEAELASLQFEVSRLSGI